MIEKHLRNKSIHLYINPIHRSIPPIYLIHMSLSAILVFNLLFTLPLIYVIFREIFQFNLIGYIERKSLLMIVMIYDLYLDFKYRHYQTVARQSARYYLDRIELPEQQLSFNYHHELSGGQQCLIDQSVLTKVTSTATTSIPDGTLIYLKYTYINESDRCVYVFPYRYHTDTKVVFPIYTLEDLSCSVKIEYDQIQSNGIDLMSQLTPMMGQR